MADLISSLFVAIPGLANAAKTIAETADAKQRNAQLIEFQKFVIDAQSKLAAIQLENQSLLRDKDDLKNQIVQMENWKAEAARYQL